MKHIKCRGNERADKGLYIKIRKQCLASVEDGGRRSNDFSSWGFPEKIIKKYVLPYILKYIKTGGYLGNVLLFNDFTGELSNYLIDTFHVSNITRAFIVADDNDKKLVQQFVEHCHEGCDPNNIVYIKGETVSKTVIDKDKNCAIKYSKSKYNYGQIAFKKLEDCLEFKFKELQNMKFNLIISNPPYAKIGANITRDIIKYIDFNEFINLLPVKDYSRNDEKDLFQYARDMEALPPNAFEGDANVRTHLARIVKESNNCTLDEFERQQYTNRELDLYFRVNAERYHKVIDSAAVNESVKNINENLTPNNSFIICDRDIQNNGLGGDDSITYKWNVEKSIDYKYFLENVGRSSSGAKVHYGFLRFSPEENKNFTDFMYAYPKFVALIFSAVNNGGSIAWGKVMPKVDWHKSWTPEEILEDYGYDKETSAAMIAAVNNAEKIAR